MATLSSSDKFLVNDGSKTETVTWGDIVGGSNPLNLTVTLSTNDPEVNTALSATGNPTGGVGPYTYTYQWQRATDSTGTSQETIAGATSQSYTPTRSDVGKFLGCTVTVVDGNGTQNNATKYTGNATVTDVVIQTPVVLTPPNGSGLSAEVDYYPVSNAIKTDGVDEIAVPGGWTINTSISNPHGAGNFARVAGNGTLVVRSTTGQISWADTADAIKGDWTDVSYFSTSAMSAYAHLAYGNNYFVVTGSEEQKFQYSSDGKTFSETTVPSSSGSSWRGLAFNSTTNQFVSVRYNAISGSSLAYCGTNVNDWTNVAHAFSGGNVHGITEGNGTWMVWHGTDSTEARISIATDPTSWTEVGKIDDDIRSIFYLNGKWIAISYISKSTYISDDGGATWEQNEGVTHNANSSENAAISDDKLVIGGGNEIQWSSDGKSFTEAPSADYSANQWQWGMGYANGYFFAFNYDLGTEGVSQYGNDAYTATKLTLVDNKVETGIVETADGEWDSTFNSTSVYSYAAGMKTVNINNANVPIENDNRSTRGTTPIGTVGTTTGKKSVSFKDCAYSQMYFGIGFMTEDGTKAIQYPGDSNSALPGHSAGFLPQPRTSLIDSYAWSQGDVVSGQFQIGYTFAETSVYKVEYDFDTKKVNLYIEGALATTLDWDPPTGQAIYPMTGTNDSGTASVTLVQDAAEDEVDVNTTIDVAFTAGTEVEGVLANTTPTAAFGIKAYDGISGSQTEVTGVDNTGKSLVWVKSRTSGGATGTSYTDHFLLDTERLDADGKPYPLHTNNNQEQTWFGPQNVKFENNGITFEADAAATSSPDRTYVAWNFRAAPKFFDIVPFEAHPVGSSGNDVTVPHSLGVTPAFIIVKSLDKTQNWYCYHKDLTTPDENFIYLNSQAKEYGAQ